MKTSIAVLSVILSSYVSLAQPKSPLRTGQMIPDIEGIYYNEQAIDLSSIDSKIIVLDFWASWCGPCAKSVKNVLKPLYDEYGRGDFEVIGISNDRKQSAWEKAIKSWDLPWPNVWDNDQSMVRNYGVRAIPTYFIIDNQGNILADNVYSADLKRTIRELLKSR